MGKTDHFSNQDIGSSNEINSTVNVGPFTASDLPIDSEGRIYHLHNLI